MNLFPAQFSDLERFADWALARETERNQKRLTEDMVEIRAFYEAIIPRMDEIIVHLNEFDLAALTNAEHNLLHLTFALADISFAIEVYGQPEVANSFQEYGGAERFVALHDGQRLPHI